MRMFTGIMLAALILPVGSVALSGCGAGAAPEPGASPVHGVLAQSQDQQIRSAIQAHLTQVNNLNLQFAQVTHLCQASVAEQFDSPRLPA